MSETPKAPLTVRWIPDLSHVDRGDWDRLARPLATPFLEYDWLRILERSDSVSDTAGWLPRHLTIWSGDRLVGAAPLYVKIHSEGEFVFDYPWMEVAHRLRIAYYPKLLGMTPFTPVPGYRFLVDPAAGEGRVTERMFSEIDRFRLRNNLSGVHFHFVDPDWRGRLVAAGYTEWVHGGFIWQKGGEASFDDYLARFKSGQRRNIRRERRALWKMGITVRILSGDEIPEALFGTMYRLYARTNDKFGPWGCKYLSRSFFDLAARRFRHRIALVVAEREGAGRPVGMAMLVYKGDRLFGRYWGCFEEVHALHFNVCYYRPIEWAIERGMSSFDPGIGGDHKVRRGFTSVPEYSFHRFSDERLRWVMTRHIGDVNQLEGDQIERSNRAVPLSATVRQEEG